LYFSEKRLQAYLKPKCKRVGENLFGSVFENRAAYLSKTKMNDLMKYLFLTFSIAVFALSSLESKAQFTTEKAIDSTETATIEEQKMQLLVVHAKTKRPIDADVMIKGLNPRKTVVLKDLSDSTMVLKKYRLYTVSVNKEGYMYFAHKFWPNESKYHLEKIELKPLTVGLKTSIEDIYFLGDETEIYHKSTPALEELISFLVMNPTVKICVIGNANGPLNDEAKSEGYYKKASEKRAQAVKDYLVQHGIAEERLTVRGMGNKLMLYPDPVVDWQVDANRRIEIEVTGL
jgi:outer membrane protein OmpA-like peptidoglycan-associated protein